MIKSCFIQHFENIEDVRQEGKVWHKLIKILFILVAAVLANAESLRDVVEFAKVREDWLKKHLELANGIPSYDTFRRVPGSINPEHFTKCFMSWTQALSKNSKGKLIAIDGKTLRGSIDGSLDKKAIHIVNAWASENHIMLGQLKTQEKSNEITAIPELLELLLIKGCIISVDAMGCQKDIAKTIIGEKADYVLALKGNQENLYNDVVSFFESEEKDGFKDYEVEQYSTLDKGHGRIEKRKYYYVKDIEWLEWKDDWAGLQGIGMVVSEVTVKDKTTIERRYYISSLETGAKEFANAVRNHWGVESAHWILDMVFREDESRVRKNNAPENLSMVRKLALNIHQFTSY